MAIEFKQNNYSGHFPEFWRGEAAILPGGFKPAKEIPTGTVVRKATPVYVDFDNMTAAICKTAKVLAGGTGTKPRVAKGHYFVVGDVVTKAGDGSATPTIKSIDTSNTSYDEITLTAAYTGLSENDILVESKEAEGENATATPLYEPNFVVGSEKKFDGKGLPTLDVAYDVRILVPSLEATPMLGEWLTGGGKYGCLKNNHNIIYIKQ